MPRDLLKDKIAETLFRRITRGVYPVGSFLPKETDLMTLEGVSRHTVRAALAKLESLGLIERRRHLGTRVVSRGKLHSFDRSLSSMSDLDRLAEHNPRRILDIREVVVSKELANVIQQPPGETLIRFTMIREGAHEGEGPIAWTQEYVERGAQELVREAPKKPDLLMIELIEQCLGKRCAEIRQTIEATVLPAEAAPYLEAAAGAPCLRIFRRYLSASGAVLLTTISWHPADRYAFNLNIRLNDNGNRIESCGSL